MCRQNTYLKANIERKNGLYKAKEGKNNERDTYDGGGRQAITGHLEHRQNTNIKVRSYILLPQRHIMWQEEI